MLIAFFYPILRSYLTTKCGHCKRLVPATTIKSAKHHFLFLSILQLTQPLIYRIQYIVPFFRSRLFFAAFFRESKAVFLGLFVELLFSPDLRCRRGLAQPTIQVHSLAVLFTFGAVRKVIQRGAFFLGGFNLQ